jgi:hypothetical protein
VEAALRRGDGHEAGDAPTALAATRDWHEPCSTILARRRAMIAGVVTTKDVLLHSPTIVHEFGLRAWLSCCKALLTNRRTTFLELVWLG